MARTAKPGLGGQKRRSAPQLKPPDQRKLETKIRNLAKDSGNVAFTSHAYDRMEERDIYDVDAYRILRTGYVEGEIEPGANAGEWKAKMVNQIKGSRYAGVVTIVLRDDKLLVLTVEWEDER